MLLFLTIAQHTLITPSQTLDDPEHVNTLLGHISAIQMTQVNIGETLNLTAAVNSSGILHTVPDYLSWTAQLVRSTGAILAISLYFPSASVSEFAAKEFAQKCADLNSKNLSVMVAIGPEMNGNFGLPIMCRERTSSSGCECMTNNGQQEIGTRMDNARQLLCGYIGRLLPRSGMQQMARPSSGLPLVYGFSLV